MTASSGDERELGASAELKAHTACTLAAPPTVDVGPSGGLRAAAVAGGDLGAQPENLARSRSPRHSVPAQSRGPWAWYARKRAVLRARVHQRHVQRGLPREARSRRERAAQEHSPWVTRPFDHPPERGELLTVLRPFALSTAKKTMALSGGAANDLPGIGTAGCPSPLCLRRHGELGRRVGCGLGCGVGCGRMCGGVRVGRCGPWCGFVDQSAVGFAFSFFFSSSFSFAFDVPAFDGAASDATALGLSDFDAPAW